jgi:hypothetical protein
MTVSLVADISSTGPTGYGSIKLGMKREAIEALKEEDGVYRRARCLRPSVRIFSYQISYRNTPQMKKASAEAGLGH